MPRDSIGKRVARAASAGGSRAYRGRKPVGWYASLAMITVVGVGIIGYSRYEVNNPTTTTVATTTTIGPGTDSEWYAGLAFDVCGKVTTLPASTNPSAVGIESYGDGILLIEPGKAPDPSEFAGNEATLLTFISHFAPATTLTQTELKLPPVTVTVGKGKKAKSHSVKQPLYKNGDKCGSKPAQLQLETWTTVAAPSGTLATGNFLNSKFDNGEMLVVAFEPKGTKIPTPPKSTESLLTELYESSVGNQGLVPTTTAATVPPTSSTVVGPTTPTVKGSTTSTVKGSSTSSTTPATTSTVKSSTTTTVK